MTMQAIGFVELGANQANITVSNIPQDGTDLLVLISARITANDSSWWMRFNGTTTGYSERLLFGNGSTAASASNSSTGFNFMVVNKSSETANTFSSGAIYIPNYSSSNNKSISADQVAENNATAARQDILAGLWSNTAPITSISFFYTNSTADIAAGTTITLYKITKGSDGVTTVS